MRHETRQRVRVGPHPEGWSSVADSGARHQHQSHGLRCAATNPPADGHGTEWPTDKLRFLRAFQVSAYRRVGQREVRFEGQTLIVIWDLRWTALPESKQREIAGIVGRAWHIVGGTDTRFRIEGQDGDVASYANDEVHLGP
jgi:hypothetical protein